MSFLVRDSTDGEEIRTLAYDIANTQANQRGMMLGWLDLWGLPKVSEDPPMAWMGMRHKPGKDGALMPGMATRAELDRAYLRPSYRLRQRVVQRLETGRLGRGVMGIYRRTRGRSSRSA